MIEKVRGIVLQQIKYTDSGIIVRFFTRERGGMSILVKGMRRKKSGKHNVFFQPLFVLDMEVYSRNDRDIQLLREYVPYLVPDIIQNDIRKTCVALFLGEILTAVIRDEETNERLYDFIEESIRYFNESDRPLANFHLSFMSRLCGYLGFEPSGKADDEPRYFDLTNGRFVVLPPPHGGYADEEVSARMALFFSGSFDETENIKLNGKQRDEILDVLLKYYSTHMPMMKKINSLEVMKELFS